MKVSKQARRAAKEFFRSCTMDGLLDETRIRVAVQKLIANKPRGHLGILTQLLRLVKMDLERHTAKVESPSTLAPDLQEEVRKDLTRIYGPGLNISFSQNPALIGGLRIRVGSDVYDGTVEGRLNSLAQSF
jgi:F-type H+-transporting ATPase subunit delta